ncbi:TIR domain-containing protein [Candidatus Poriferisodalis sp.]|uniref:TIR domain-containing protein n=1 Tax=Candidatus Poriferisodalis sp. TaxID=3101277 RepID=UPI003B013A4C
MTKNPRTFRVRLFYSYSHQDIEYKESMEKVLVQLRHDGLLQSWSDSEILGGESISASIDTEMPQSHIIAFLLSPDFIASEACRKEWEDANQLVHNGDAITLLPIILRPCAWKDLTGGDLKALPRDANPVSLHEDEDIAWHDVYEGIKAITHSIRGTHTVKSAFLNKLNTATIPSVQPLPLDDIYVFPRLASQYEDTESGELYEELVESAPQLLSRNRTIVHGQERCGKTTLASHLTLTLVNAARPVLLVDLGDFQYRLNERKLREQYEEQFDGDFDIWMRSSDKTLIVDNFSQDAKSLDFVAEKLDDFERVILLTSSDLFHAFLDDDVRLADYGELYFMPLTFRQQEQLIRKGLATLELKSPITDQLVDQAEDRVNSVIVTNKLVPRYPFYVMAILQTLDIAGRDETTVTSYGHCYYLLIVVSLKRAGISERDDSLNAAFNFVEHLARETFVARLTESTTRLNFDEFIERYEERYIVPRSLISRLTDERFGILDKSGRFKSSYMYYYFLGKVLATDAEFAKEHIDNLAERSFIQGNYLALLFTIHHARDEEVIDDILIRTMIEFTSVPVASLNKKETSRFSSLVTTMPERILSERSVDDERAEERDQKDEMEEESVEIEPDPSAEDVDTPGNNILRVLKNNKLLGQVLRNQYGSLERPRIELIVETITDSSLRLVNILLSSDSEIHKNAAKIAAEHPEANEEEIRRGLRYLSLVWTIWNLLQAVEAINVPNIRDAVSNVVKRHGTPAYQILGYFNEIDSLPRLTKNTASNLKRLMDGTSDRFVQMLLSYRTQMYMNTHRSDESVEQAICAALKIKYSPKRRALMAARQENRRS